MQASNVSKSTPAIFEVAWRRQSFERELDPTDQMTAERETVT
jgi:hypothetical protein